MMEETKAEELQHELFKSKDGWNCRHCSKAWKRKPRNMTCSGVKTISESELPDNLKTEWFLTKHNLRAIAPPLYRCRFGGRIRFVYDINQTEKIDPKLPEVISKERKNELGYLTKNQLNKQSLDPGSTPPACAVAYWDEDGWDYNVYWKKEDCGWKARDEFLAKTTLKKTYLLSDGWVKRIGNPDKFIDNPHNRRSNIQLYSKQRVEAFLADNAEEYAGWLDKRDRLVELFEQNKDKIQASRNLLKQQYSMCLDCQYSGMSPTGLLCTVFPMGLEKDQMPCHEHIPKNK